MGAPQTSPLELPSAAAADRLAVRSFGPFTFDPAQRLLRKDGQEIAVPPRVLSVLDVLLQHAGEVVAKQALIDTVWKDAFVTDTSLAEAISALRQTLGDDPQGPTYIQTLHRRGYRFVAAVSSTSVPSPRVVPAQVGPAADVVAPSIARGLLPWSIAALCAALALAAVWQYTRRAPETAPAVARFAVLPAPGTRLDDGVPALAMSPDGRLMAWTGCDEADCRLYVRPLDSVEPAALPATRGARAPFFSPDGQWIAYFADGRLMKVASRGGEPIAIADAPTPLGGAWIGDDIVYAGSPFGGLMRVAADGGEPRPLTIPNESAGEVRHSWPAHVPGTRALLFIVETAPATDAREGAGVLASLSLDTVGPPASTSPAAWRTLFSGVTLARGAASDTIVFGRNAEIYGVKFDPLRLAAAGVPRPLVGDVATARGRAQFAMSANGTLLHAIAARQPGDAAAAAGERVDTESALSRFRDAVLSPDGSRIAGVSVEGARAEIWIADVRRGAATRLMHTGISASPVWSADGRTVFFANRTSGAFEIWRGDADGSSAPVRIFGGERHAFPLSASPDGARLAILSTATATRADILMLPLGEKTAPRALVQSPFDETAASFSPDSTMLAYQSAATGRWEVYVQRIADGRQIVVSTAGGERPIWAKDGLYYQSDRTVMRAAIADGPIVQSTAAAALTGDERRALAAGAMLQGVAPDGRVLLANGAGKAAGRATSAIASLGWLAAVRPLLGPPEAQLLR